MRTRFVGAILTALITGVAVGLPMATVAARAAIGSSPARANLRAASVVTLPTGDRVLLAGSATKPSVLVEPAAAGGPGRILVRHRLGAELYVVPADAEPYLGRFLDPGLFDVTRLKAALKPNGRLPVRISYRGSVPAVAGIKITSASAGVASGYLTPATSSAFGRALTAQWEADSRAGWPDRTSLFSGVTRIVADLPGPVTVKPNYPMFTLIVKVIGTDGKPLAFGVVPLMNVDNGSKYFQFAEIVDGEARVSVPKGHYSAIAADLVLPLSTAGRSTLRIVTATEYKVAGSGQTLTIDLRKATARPSVTVPKKADLYAYTFEWDRADAAKTSLQENGYLVDPSEDFFVAPARPATIGKVVTTQDWALAGPGQSPAYTYDLAATADRIPARLHYVFKAAGLGIVNGTYYGDGGAKTGAAGRTALFPSGATSIGPAVPVGLGTTRREYVGAVGASPLWIDWALLNNDSLDDPGYVADVPRTIPAGTSRQTTWFRGPLAAGIPTQAAGGFCFGCRNPGLLEVSLAPLMDSVPTHSGDALAAVDGLPVTRFRFYTNGKLVHDENDIIGGEFPVSTAKATYKVVLDVDRRLQQPNQSTISHTELTFASSAGTGGKLPASWECDVDSTPSCRVLPILQARMALPTGLDGALPAGKSAVTVTAAQVQYATRSAIASAQLEIRPAGSNWTTVKLTALGGGKYRGTVDNTGLEGSVVDVRISAADKAGSTVQQTVLRAYTVAGS